MYLSMSLTSAESSLRGFLITGRESSLNRYNAALPQVDEYRHEVIQRFKDDPDPAMNETMFSELLNARLLMMRVSIAIRRSPDFHIEEWQHNNFNNESDLLMDRLHHMIFTLVTHIKQRTREDLRHTQREFGGLWIYLGIGFACVFVTIVLTLISSGRSNLKALQRQNKKLQASLQKAEEATKMKASFLANISHEVNARTRAAAPEPRAMLSESRCGAHHLSPAVCC
jgi:CHASE3 domain sensor protein